MTYRPYAMEVLNAQADALGIVHSPGFAPLALSHDLQVRQMPARCGACRAALTDDELDYLKRANTAPGQGRCFICLDEDAMLEAHESRVEAIYGERYEAIGLM